MLPYISVLLNLEDTWLSQHRPGINLLLILPVVSCGKEMRGGGSTRVLLEGPVPPACI